MTLNGITKQICSRVVCLSEASEARASWAPGHCAEVSRTMCSMSGCLNHVTSLLLLPDPAEKWASKRNPPET